jgi:ubiquinone/menaquinone biosynthesis C-methylase UbiE
MAKHPLEPFEGYFSGENCANFDANHFPEIFSGYGAMELFERGPLVDLGCGIGEHLIAFQRRFPNLTTVGVDCVVNRLLEAQKRSPQSLLVKSVLRALPFLDDSIPLLFSSKIYQLCNEKSYEIEEMLGEAFRVLKPRPHGIYIMTNEFFENVPAFYDKVRKAGFTLVEAQEDGHYVGLLKEASAGARELR